MAKKILSSQTLSGSNQNSFNKVSNNSISNSRSWNTSNVSKKTKNALKNAEKEYSSDYQDYLNRAVQNIEDRKKFSYDMNKDALYQQYAKQYKALGNQAMQETQANASTLTGGYGSSYVQTAGQQAYNDYLQQLNNIVPDMYAQARSNYDAETSELYNKADMYSALESEAYNRYVQNREYYQNKYDSEWSRNAVAYTSQNDKSTQTEQSSSSSSSSSSTYTPKAKATRPQLTKDDYKDVNAAKSFLSNNGMGAYVENIKTKTEYMKEAGDSYKKGDYRRYLNNYLIATMNQIKW